MNDRGHITYINPFGLEFFGFDREELVGRSPVGLIVPEQLSKDRPSSLVADILKDPAPYTSHANENIKKDGTRVWVSWTNKGKFDNKMAMYRSKEKAKGEYAFFTSKLNQQVARRVELETDLRHALVRQEFSLYYQPKLKIIGAEGVEDSEQLDFLEARGCDQIQGYYFPPPAGGSIPGLSQGKQLTGFG